MAHWALLAAQKDVDAQRMPLGYDGATKAMRKRLKQVVLVFPSPSRRRWGKAMTIPGARLISCRGRRGPKTDVRGAVIYLAIICPPSPADSSSATQHPHLDRHRAPRDIPRRTTDRDKPCTSPMLMANIARPAMHLFLQLRRFNLHTQQHPCKTPKADCARPVLGGQPGSTRRDALTTTPSHRADTMAHGKHHGIPEQSRITTIEVQSPCA